MKIKMKKTLALALAALFCGMALPTLSFAADDVPPANADDKTGDYAVKHNGDNTTAPAPAGFTYKGITIQPNGFLASETVYRTNNSASDIATAYSKMPFPNAAGYGVGEFRGTERQSRFSLLATGDVDSQTHLAGYYEIDFLAAGTTSNSNQSNSYTPRTRVVYMTMDWDQSGLHLLAGQNWSLAVMNTKGITPRSESIPMTIDAQYAVGFNWERQWQLRVVKDWYKKYWVAVSFENAQTVGVAGTLASGTGNTYTVPYGQLMSNNLSMNSYPDMIAKLAYESGFGHYEVFNVARNFQSRYGGATLATQQNRQNTWTDAVGAGAMIPVWPTKIDLSLSGMYGKGAGRYGTSQLSDATYNSDGSLNPLTGSSYVAQVIYHTTPHLDTYATYGEEHVEAATGSGFGYGDGAVASDTGCLTLGGTCAANLKKVAQINVGGWWSFYKGAFGAAKLGLQYSHTTLDTYADNAGLSPSTSENMFYSSLRYYPF